jgi:uncharacterized RDD family membrane protein YckC
MFCTECGRENEADTEFCIYCGKKISAHQTVPTRPDELGKIPPLPPDKSQGDETVPQIRPWVRFFARFIDVGLSYCVTLVFFIVLGFLIYILFPQNNFFSNISSVMDILITTLTTFLVLALIEPFFLSAFGQTPGKWLLKTRVNNADGSLLTFSQALSRSFSVYTRGFLFGIPFLNWITLLIESSKLEKEGKTTWDKKGNFIVRHEKIGIPRVIAAFIIVVGFRLLMMSLMPSD